MGFVLDHGAQPLPASYRSPVGSGHFAVQVLGGEPGKDIDRLAMQAFSELHDLVVAIGEFFAASRVAAGPARHGFRVHVAIDGRDVPHQVSEGELAVAVGPVDLVVRDAMGDTHGAVVDFFEVVEEGGELLYLHVSAVRVETSFGLSGLLIGKYTEAMPETIPG